MQDANAVAASPSGLVSRSVSKGNAFYNNEAWDLVDAIKNGKCKLDDLKDDDLPAGFKALDKAARQAKVDEAAKQRGVIQAQILDLNTKRERFLAAERKKQAAAGAKEDSLDRVIIKAVREQAVQHHFTFE